MKWSLLKVMLTTAVVAAITSTLGAQTKEIPGDATTITATIEAIDAANRTLTLKGAGGNYVAITVPRSVTRFPEFKVGDTVTARYYDNIVIRVKPPGEAAVDTLTEGVSKGSGAPAATASTQRTITASIIAIDNSIPSITFKGEKVNWQYSSRVSDKATLAKVKVGDRVDITWTEALTVSVTTPKKD